MRRAHGVFVAQDVLAFWAVKWTEDFETQSQCNSIQDSKSLFNNGEKNGVQDWARRELQGMGVPHSVRLRMRASHQQWVPQFWKAVAKTGCLAVPTMSAMLGQFPSLEGSKIP